MADQEGKEGGSRTPRWPFVLATFVVVGVVAVVLAIIFVPTRTVWTDDAYITAHYSVIAPRVSGQVQSVNVDDNQPVRAGQVLATLDPRDYETTLAQMRAILARDTASVTDAKAAVTRQPALIDEAKAQVGVIAARMVFARQNAQRYSALSRTGAGSAQEHQQSDADLRQLQAELTQAQAQVTAAVDQLAILRAQHQASQETVRLDRAQVHQAELNLSYTVIRAPLDGMVGQRSVQVGNYVAPGAAMMAVVPLDRVWVEANYRELALRHMRPGQHVRVHVDAYDITLDGIVDSVPPASGAAFAPVAPENATGNFTKIVQRLPVKIVFAPNQPLVKLLRLGFSVETSVDTGFEDVVGAQERSTGMVTAK